MPASKSPEARLKRANDKLWSEIIRRRDGQCLVCGVTENLHAHHAVVRKQISLDTRWHLGNGVALCYKDHMINLHRNGDAVFLHDYLSKLDAKIPPDYQDGLVELAQAGRRERTKTGLVEHELTTLRAVNASLTKTLADMRESRPTGQEIKAMAEREEHICHAA